MFQNFANITFTHKTNEIPTILHVYTYQTHHIINISKLFSCFLDVLAYGNIIEHGSDDVRVGGRYYSPLSSTHSEASPNG